MWFSLSFMFGENAHVDSLWFYCYVKGQLPLGCRGIRIVDHYNNGFCLDSLLSSSSFLASADLTIRLLHLVRSTSGF